MTFYMETFPTVHGSPDKVVIGAEFVFYILAKQTLEETAFSALSSYGIILTTHHKSRLVT